VSDIDPERSRAAGEAEGVPCFRTVDDML